MSAANTRRLKVFTLLRRLEEASAMSAREIHEYINELGFEYTQKTIERDLEYLSLERGVIATEEFPRRYYAEGSFDFKQELILDFSVVETIHIALQNLKETSHEYFEDHINKAEIALEESLSPDLNDHLRGVRHKYHFDYGLTGRPCPSNKDDIKRILLALRKEQIIYCVNDSPYKENKKSKVMKKLAPLYFILSAGMPYLIAKDLEDDSVAFKRYRLTRLSQVKLGDVFDIFDYEVEYRPSDFVGGWKGESQEIKIHADERVGTFFTEKVLHPSQSIEKLNDNEYLISFKAPLSDELVRILAGFGGGILHISPEPLLDKIEEIWHSGRKVFA